MASDPSLNSVSVNQHYHVNVNETLNQSSSNVSSNQQAVSINSVSASNNAQPPSLQSSSSSSSVDDVQALELKFPEQNKANSALLKDLASDCKRCDATFDAVVSDDKVPKHIRQMLTTIDAHYDTCDFSRCDEALDKQNFSKEMFRTALLHGGHMVFEDNGELCKTLLQQGGQINNGWGSYLSNMGKQSYNGEFYDRVGQSSHYKRSNNDGKFSFTSSTYQTPQWGSDIGHAVQGSGRKEWMGHLLIGTTFDGHSFIQFENNGTANFSDKYPSHGKDFYNHWKSDYLQVGPMGKVEASEKKGTHFTAKPK
ncbi:hypothetical protein [Chitinimonas lacunae]|uniref:Uncharacterized protein n=1 Tax=Chitinimonas lacunae TaxID=1963018 RepID=A0ABV8MRU8_9NEIS